MSPREKTFSAPFSLSSSLISSEYSVTALASSDKPLRLRQLRFSLSLSLQSSHLNGLVFPLIKKLHRKPARSFFFAPPRVCSGIPLPSRVPLSNPYPQSRRIPKDSRSLYPR